MKFKIGQNDVLLLYFLPAIFGLVALTATSPKPYWYGSLGTIVTAIASIIVASRTKKSNYSRVGFWMGSIWLVVIAGYFIKLLIDLERASHF